MSARISQRKAKAAAAAAAVAAAAETDEQHVHAASGSHLRPHSLAEQLHAAQAAQAAQHGHAPPVAAAALSADHDDDHEMGEDGEDEEDNDGERTDEDDEPAPPPPPPAKQRKGAAAARAAASAAAAAAGTPVAAAPTTKKRAAPVSRKKKAAAAGAAAASSSTSPAAADGDDGDDAGSDADDPSSQPTKKVKKSRRDPDAVRDHKGLRHFSILVCEKLAKLGTSTYKEIADQLVQEANLQQESYVGYDEKNIRRRIYDALNVLMAMDIIGKERKAIRWKGFEQALGLPLPPPGAPAMPAAAVAAGTRQQEAALAAQLQASKERRARIAERRQTLEELALQYVGLKTLTDRNARPDFQASAVNSERIAWPFLLLEAPARTIVDCEMNDTQSFVILTYSEGYRVHDHPKLLQQIGECAVQHFQQHIQPSAPEASGAATATGAATAGSAKSATPAPDDPFNALVSAAAASPKLKPAGSYAARRAAATASTAVNGSAPTSAATAAAAGSASLAAASSPAAAAECSPLSLDAGDPRALFSPSVWKLLPENGTLRESAAAYAEALANGTLVLPTAPPAALVPPAAGIALSTGGTNAGHANAVANAWGAQQFVPPSSSSFLSPLLPSGMAGTGSQLGLSGSGRAHSGGSVGGGLGLGAMPSPAGLSSAFLPSPVKLELSSSGSSLIGGGTSGSLSQPILPSSQSGWESSTTPSPPSPSVKLEA